MINPKQLLTDLQKRVALLENDLRTRCETQPEVNAPLEAEYNVARAKGRTGLTYNAWRDEELTQVAVSWILGGVFVRFLEDNELIEVPLLAGATVVRQQRAQDEHDLFFRQHPTSSEREYFEQVFTAIGQLPGMREFFDRRHNPLWRIGPSADAARDLLGFWRKTDPDTGCIGHDFTDPDWNTRFLGDLYQDLSEAARKKFALLQTPTFVEEFILDRTLTPAIQTFGYQVARMIDPTCGSGHFCLGGFDRLFRLWQQHNPGENPRVLAQKALDGVYGVDLNPYAVAIARFRLLLAALRVCDIHRLKDAPDFKIHLAVGDSLLHGPEAGHVMDRNALKLRIESANGTYQCEDADALAEILSQHYHAVVGNPPYITVKDKALNSAYREMFKSCHRKYSLAVPFMERFLDLAIAGDGTGQKPAGYVGQITSNSFMKREFGKKLVEKVIPNCDLTYVIDTAGAYIPGHGTPTVIIFGKNQTPVAETIRTVMGIKGEPSTPADPSRGLVWTAILSQIDQPGSQSEFVSVADTKRANFHTHPWSIGGGGAAELKDLLDESGDKTLTNVIHVMGVFGMTNADEVMVAPEGAFQRARVEAEVLRRLVVGDDLRDWSITEADHVTFPYQDGKLCQITELRELHRWLWPTRTTIGNRATFNKGTYFSDGRAWWSWHQVAHERLKPPTTITWPEVATHNHFVLDGGGRVFKHSAPVIKLKAEATVDDHMSLLGLLNSSSACFWLKQVCHNKGSTVDEHGARQRTAAFEDFYAFNGTQVSAFPIPTEKPVSLVRELNRLAQELKTHIPAVVLDSSANHTRPTLDTVRESWGETLRRMIALQEELDWECYRFYGLLTNDLNYRNGDVPLIKLGERAFEIVKARKMAAGELATTWFERHGSTPITELPAHWPPAYRQLVERRIELIESDRNIDLIEQPEYKRRWNTEPWDKQLECATREWLLNRLEGYFFEGNRVCVLTDGFSPAQHGFPAAGHPALVSTNQLAAVVETDAAWLRVAEIYRGGPGFSVSELVRELVESESEPFLPFQRYKESGLRKRQDWEQVWELQREEDRIDAALAALQKQITDRIEDRLQNLYGDVWRKEREQRQRLDQMDREYHQQFHPGTEYDPEHPHYDSETSPSNVAALVEFQKLRDVLRVYRDAKSELDAARSVIVDTDEKIKEYNEAIRQLPPKPNVPVPPKYASADFKGSVFWKLRGKLDVPKERWVIYPGAEREGDASPVIAWAGWDHLQQAQALAAYYVEASQQWGWPAEKLRPLLAGLAELLPWLKQWHNQFNPDYASGLGDYFAGFLDEEARKQGTTVEALNRLRLGAGEL